jgi:ribosomal protein S18 acetylase RimI-like enzyme
VKVFLRHHPEIALGVMPGVALNLIDSMRRTVGAEILAPRPPAKVRRAGPSDARAIAEVQVASWQAAYRDLMPAERLAAFTVEVREKAWREILAGDRADRTTTVLEQSGRVVAFASFGPSRDVPDLGEVWALYAHPGAWGTGAGRTLLEGGLAFLEERGWARSMLWVLAGNTRAIRFYEAAGYRLDGERSEADGLPHVRMSRG